MKQFLDNIPAEILTLKRFFKTREDNPKAGLRGWNKPENQSLCSELTGHRAFMPSTAAAGGLIFYDFDHVLDEEGIFVNPTVEGWYRQLHIAGTYCERSQSGRGLHIFAAPTHELQKPKGALALDFGSGVKIEVFYQTDKACLITGDCFNCAPKAPIITGSIADIGFEAIVAAIEKTHNAAKAKERQGTRTDLNIEDKCPQSHIEKTITPEKNKEVASELQNLIDAINAIEPAQLEDKGYLQHSENGEPRPNGYICPWCGSGEHENKSGALSYYTDANGGYFACHSHKCGGNVLKLLSKVYGIDNHGKDFFKLLKTAAKDFNIKYDPKIFDLPSRFERIAQLEELHTRPQSSARDNAIRDIIRGLCEWSRDNNGRKTNIKSSAENYELVFTYDPALRNLFGFDKFRQEIVFLRRAPWHDPDDLLKDSWDDSDDSELRTFLALNYKEMGSIQRTLDFVTKFARLNSFHSIKKFFNSLPAWDGTPRAETIFCKFLGAQDCKYTREVTKNFLLGAIARAFYPGCDYQSSLVLSGPQGIGKSRVLRMLGGKHGVNPKGESWHIALRDSIDDSHAVDAMRKGWLIELEEFAATSRADINAMKGVLSADDVTRRFAYDRRARTIKSHWIFAGTTNDDSPLRDQTGNRRFLPIKCCNTESTIVEGMTADYIRQCWAEAFAWFKKLFPTADSFDAEKLRLPVEIQKLAADHASKITQDDGLSNEVVGFLDRKILPDFIWHLLSKEERRKFFVNGGCLIMVDAVSELNHRRRARGGNEDSVQVDIDKIYNFIEGTAGKNFVRHEVLKRGDNVVHEYYLYGSEFRQHICQSEIFNECFGADNRKRIGRIAEILSRLNGWAVGARLRLADPIYPDQRLPYYREQQ